MKVMVTYTVDFNGVAYNIGNQAIFNDAIEAEKFASYLNKHRDDVPSSSIYITNMK